MTKKENKEMLHEVVHLVEKMQFIVTNSLDRINEDNSLEPVDFSDKLNEITSFIQQLSQIIHQT